MTSSAREAARAARAEREANRPENPDEARLAALEATVSSQQETINQLVLAIQELSETLALRIDKVAERTSANERMISVKTIESLARSQVARIMREEAR